VAEAGLEAVTLETAVASGASGPRWQTWRWCRGGIGGKRKLVLSPWMGAAGGSHAIVTGREDGREESWI